MTAELDEPECLFKQADRSRAVAETATDDKVRQTLLDMAEDYEHRAQSAIAKQKVEPRRDWGGLR